MNFKKLSIIFASFLMVFTLSACNEGPAEEAGSNIDEAMTDAGNAMEDTCEDAKEGMGMKDQDC